MSSKKLFLALILAAVAVEGMADVVFKKWAMNERAWLLAVGVLLYAVGTVAWAFSLRYEHLSRAVTLFTIANLVGVTLVGVILFHEDLSFINKLGIVLGLVSILLIEG